MNWKKIFFCFLFGNHDWTCKAMQNIPPTKFEIENLEEEFKSYSKMYCSRCGKMSKLNLK